MGAKPATYSCSDDAAAGTAIAQHSKSHSNARVWRILRPVAASPARLPPLPCNKCDFSAVGVPACHLTARARQRTRRRWRSPARRWSECSARPRTTGSASRRPCRSAATPGGEPAPCSKRQGVTPRSIPPLGRADGCSAPPAARAAPASERCAPASSLLRRHRRRARAAGARPGEGADGAHARALR